MCSSISGRVRTARSRRNGGATQAPRVVRLPHDGRAHERRGATHVLMSPGQAWRARRHRGERATWRPVVTPRAPDRKMPDHGRCEGGAMGTATMQGQQWGARAADWVELGEPISEPAFRSVYARAGVGRGTRVLDVGCGGGTALVYARSLGAEVSGFDASEALI